MGLLDRFLGGPSEPEKETGLNRQPEEKSLADQSAVEKAIAARDEKTSLTDCLKVSFTDIAGLGVGFAQMLPQLRTVTTTAAIEQAAYIPINNKFNEALRIAKKSNPNVFVGSFKSAANGENVFANFVKASPESVTTSTVMPINPASMMMAAMLVEVEKKLDSIQKTADNILSFLEADKQAEQQGNINILKDSLQNYKYNWDNPQYLQNHHMKALDIKQKAEQNIIFYQSRIASTIEKIPTIHLDSNVKSSLAELERLFGEYRMAVYMYGFSSFLEIMLLGNFLEEYLQQAADKVSQYNLSYHQQFGQCEGLIRNLSSGSVQTQVVKALGGAGKFLGKAIGDSRYLNRGQVDEWLKKGGQKLIDGQDKKVDKTTALFNPQEETGSEMFVDSIRNMDRISNHTTGMIFDNDTLYIACTEKAVS